MTAKENKRQPISTGSEWTFDLIQAYDREIEEMTDMMSATRSFETGVEVLNRIKSMQQGLLKLGEA